MKLEDKLFKNTIIVPITDILTVVMYEREGEIDFEKHILKRKDVINYFKQKLNKPIAEINVVDMLDYLKNKYGEKSHIYKELKSVYEKTK